MTKETAHARHARPDCPKQHVDVKVPEVINVAAATEEALKQLKGWARRNVEHA